MERGSRPRAYVVRLELEFHQTNSVAPPVQIAFRRCNFIQRAAEMDRAGAAASLRFPRNWFTQSVIDFENSRCVPKRFQSPAVAWRHLVATDAQELPDRNIQNNGAGFWQFV